MFMYSVPPVFNFFFLSFINLQLRTSHFAFQMNISLLWVYLKRYIIQKLNHHDYIICFNNERENVELLLYLFYYFKDFIFFLCFLLTMFYERVYCQWLSFFFIFFCCCWQIKQNCKKKRDFILIVSSNELPAFQTKNRRNIKKNKKL